MKITDALATEHAVFLRVFDQIEKVLPRVTTLREATTIAQLIEGLLAGHADTERHLAFLALDHVLADRHELDSLHQDHEEIDRRFGQVATANDCTEACRLLKAGLQATRKHFRYEERTVFPILERCLQEQTLRELGDHWRRQSTGAHLPGRPMTQV